MTFMTIFLIKADESGKWCAEWQGVSPEYGDYVEQLCECLLTGTTNSNSLEEFCQVRYLLGSCTPGVLIVSKLILDQTNRLAELACYSFS